MNVVFNYQWDHCWYTVEVLVEDSRLKVNKILVAGPVEFYAIIYAVEYCNINGLTYLITEPAVDAMAWLSFIEEFSNMMEVA